MTNPTDNRTNASGGKVSSIYLRAGDLKVLDKLKKRLGLDQSEIMRLALRALCLKEGLEV